MHAHRELSPAIHYWGTPVVLISTLNEEGSVNVAPISSAWWLGWSCMLGFDASSEVELRIVRTHVAEALLRADGKIDVDAWRPLLMSFRGLFARGERLPSALERGDEDRYAPWKGGPLLRWASTMWGFGSRARARKVLDGGHATTEGDSAEEAPRGEVTSHG